MSQERPPIGPPPQRRETNVQSLLAANRTPSVQPPVVSPPQAPAERLDSRDSGQNGPVSPAEQGSGDNRSALRQITFYMSADQRQRAKAAYQATSGIELDVSWSAFITRAVMAEVERREDAHNEGRAFPGGSGKLTPGRKLAP